MGEDPRVYFVWLGFLLCVEKSPGILEGWNGKSHHVVNFADRAFYDVGKNPRGFFYFAVLCAFC